MTQLNLVNQLKLVSNKPYHSGGFCVKLFGRLLSKLVGVDIVLPPLLGMLMVGVLLKNIPYNFGQFGRAECTIDGRNATFVDSLHDLENPDHGSFKRSIPDSVLLQVCLIISWITAFNLSSMVGVLKINMMG